MRPAGFALVLSALALSCGGAPAASEAASFAGDPVVSIASDTGALRIAVRSSPQPIVRGTCSLEMTITDAAGAPRDGLALAVAPWMPAMGHGASVRPIVTAMGRGRYVASDVNLFMPGRWELRTTLSGSVADTAAPELDVP